MSGETTFKQLGVVLVFERTQTSTVFGRVGRLSFPVRLHLLVLFSFSRLLLEPLSQLYNTEYVQHIIAKPWEETGKRSLSLSWWRREIAQKGPDKCA